MYMCVFICISCRIHHKCHKNHIFATLARCNLSRTPPLPAWLAGSWSKRKRVHVQDLHHTHHTHTSHSHTHTHTSHTHTHTHNKLPVTLRSQFTGIMCGLLYERSWLRMAYTNHLLNRKISYGDGVDGVGYMLGDHAVAAAAAPLATAKPAVPLHDACETFSASWPCFDRLIIRSHLVMATVMNDGDNGDNDDNGDNMVTIWYGNVVIMVMMRPQEFGVDFKQLLFGVEDC